MKNILFTLFFMGMVNMQAQTLRHSFGVNYDRYSATYRNADAISVMYHPQLHFRSASFRMQYALAAPMTLGKIISASRVPSENLVFELPVALEMRYSPCGIRNCNPRKHYGVLIGAGVSRLMPGINWSSGINYIQAYIGFRLPTIAPIELRMGYGGNFALPGRDKRFRLGISYLL